MTTTTGPTQHRVEWLRLLPFFGVHLACLLVFVVGWSPIAVGMAIRCLVVTDDGIVPVGRVEGTIRTTANLDRSEDTVLGFDDVW